MWATQGKECDLGWGSSLQLKAVCCPQLQYRTSSSSKRFLGAHSRVYPRPPLCFLTQLHQERSPLLWPVLQFWFLHKSTFERLLKMFRLHCFCLGLLFFRGRNGGLLPWFLTWYPFYYTRLTSYYLYFLSLYLTPVRTDWLTDCGCWLPSSICAPFL